ncbi:MAG TPA: hypothetical protein VMJ10_22880 [Kofleriaceae bacterium]|nr:hypothetical protein [Kofleriaceae bacterium]
MLLMLGPAAAAVREDHEPGRARRDRDRALELDPIDWNRDVLDIDRHGGARLFVGGSVESLGRLL